MRGKLQAISYKLRAASGENGAASCKLQAASNRRQLVSYKTLIPGWQLSAFYSWLKAYCFYLTARSSQLKARSLLLVACSFFLLSAASAQQVSAAIDRDKILLGEQITLQLKAEGIRTKDNPIVAWFNLPDTVNHLEVVKRSPIDTLDVDGSTTYMQNFTITSFDSGKWILPAMQLKLQNSNTVLMTDSFTIEVLPVDVSNLKQYHEMKDIIPVEVKTDWRRVFIFAVILVAMAIFIYYLTKRKKKQPAVKQLTVKPSLFEDTIAKLEALQKEALPATIFYARLDAICRTYLQEQLYIRALHLTQDELTQQLSAYLQQQEVRIAFYQLLRLINAVKFAKYTPPASQQAESINTAKATVQYIHYQLQRSQQHAQPLVSKY
jgi:hypothetical protein